MSTTTWTYVFLNPQGCIGDTLHGVDENGLPVAITMKDAQDFQKVIDAVTSEVDVAAATIEIRVTAGDL